MRRIIQTILQASDSGSLTKIIFAGKRKKSLEYSKITLRPVTIRGEYMYQAEFHFEKKGTHQNTPYHEMIDYASQWICEDFKQINILTEAEDIQILAADPENPRITRRAYKKLRKAAVLDHNRKKHYIIEDGKPCDFLIKLGVMSPEGKVFQKHYSKFRQINRFLEFIEDILPELDKGRELTILDFGCGKSYLTFAMYYYLHELKEYDIRIIGLDLKKDVIRHCNELSEKYGYEKLRFLEGDIADYTGVNKVDMVVTLHACDTATDYALAKAVGWDAKVILSVPCCQHELNRQIKNEILEPILKYGLLKERMAALITDGLRAQYLEREGYEAQILEFIDMEHTPKNILIRAVKKRHAKEDNNIEASIKRCEAALRVSPTLGRLLDGFATESANSEKDHPEKEDKEGV